jgi:hypothetical protein
MVHSDLLYNFKGVRITAPEFWDIMKVFHTIRLHSIRDLSYQSTRKDNLTGPKCL